jgi:signal transduction histidine kinase
MLEVQNNKELLLFFVVQSILLFTMLYMYLLQYDAIRSIRMLVIASMGGSFVLLGGYLLLENNQIVIAAMLKFSAFILLLKLTSNLYRNQILYTSSIFVLLYYVIYIMVHYFMHYHLEIINLQDLGIHLLSLFVTQICLLGLYDISKDLFVVGRGNSLMLVVCFSTGTMIVIPSFLSISPDLATWNFMSFITLLWIGIICLLGNIIVYVLLKTTKKLMKEEQIRFSTNLIKIYQEQLTKEKYNLHKIRHDMKKNIIVIQQLLQLHEQEEALKHIETITDKINTTTNTVYTNIIILDAYLNYVVDKNKDITFTIVSNTLQDSNINDSDFLLVVMNLVDNAIENVGEPKNISISMFYHEEVIIKISNTCKDNPHGHAFKTKKSDTKNHGYGLQIVHDILERYISTYIQNYDNGVYSVYISLEEKIHG